MSVAADPHLTFAFFAAHVFAESRVFDEDAESEKAELGIMGNTHRSVRVLQEVRGHGKKARERGFFVGVFWFEMNHVVAEELVRVCEVVGGHQDSSLLGRPRQDVSDALVSKAIVLQFSKHSLRFLRGGRIGFVSRTWREGAKSKEYQCVGQSPTLGDIILYSNIAIAQATAGQTNALGNFLDASLVDKVFESKLVRVLEFKLVIVCQ